MNLTMQYAVKFVIAKETLMLDSTAVLIGGKPYEIIERFISSGQEFIRIEDEIGRFNGWFPYRFR